MNLLVMPPPKQKIGLNVSVIRQLQPSLLFRGKTPVFRLLKLWDTIAMTQGRVCLSTLTHPTYKDSCLHGTIINTLQSKALFCHNSYKYECEDVLLYVVLLAMLLTQS